MLEDRISRWSDQYALAITYFQLRTGIFPFTTSHLRLFAPPDLLSLPAGERTVVARALARTPEDRWPSCRAFVEALEAAARTEAPELSTEGNTKLDGPERPAPPPRSVTAATAEGLRRRWRSGIAATLLGLTCLAAYALVPGFGFAPTPPPPPPPHLQRPTAPGDAKVITNTIGMKLVLIPAGTFEMGSPDSDEDAEDNEKPRHTVQITRSFSLGVSEVTQEQYRAVTGASPSHFKGSDDLPVENVSWTDAIAFCNKLSKREGLKPYYQSDGGVPAGGDGYRLPTEAEWEYACRAGSTTRFSFGDDAARLGEYAWYHGHSDARQHPVGQKRPNAFGLHDMHGNVWEWCWDGYAPKYYAESPADDPHGPSKAGDRVVRGGSWDSEARNCRSALRDGYAPESRYDSLGFRIARDPSSR
jgi:formylglycine-generating enzyme required for sulfatase activity